MALGWFLSAIQAYLIDGRPSLVECFDEAVAGPPGSRVTSGRSPPPPRERERPGPGLSTVAASELDPERAESFAWPTLRHPRVAGDFIAAMAGFRPQLLLDAAREIPRYRVPTTGLMKALEIEQIPVYLDDADQGAAFAARFS